ncbi:hypothetical protein GUJ93_ZPchr0002g25914 [Zizania palustris]|uniref:Uncharacterized protein n=1 Tax=Zizania palustris TaxID=103762 RepID=A0A8J5V3T0_ZIZPA|nr:hypothetical protein GUJ93_ZPchr0002g25914 [Zizania palustris]
MLWSIIISDMWGPQGSDRGQTPLPLTVLNSTSSSAIARPPSPPYARLLWLPAAPSSQRARDTQRASHLWPSTSRRRVRFRFGVLGWLVEVSAKRLGSVGPSPHPRPIRRRAARYRLRPNLLYVRVVMFAQ